MADHVVDISGSTTMMIRDTGGVVEFWFKTGSSTWNNEQPWSYAANGGGWSGTFRLLRGGFWQKFGEVYVGYDQDVRFSVTNTGLGFPSYDFWVHIARSTVPGAPTIHQTHAISASHLHVEFSAGYDGGSAIVEWQIGFGGNPSTPEGYWGSGGASDIGPFPAGTRVYFWARGRNAVGWGAWSNRTEATTWRAPDSPNPITFSQIAQTSVSTLFADRGNGGTAIVERQIGYGLDPDGATLYVNVVEPWINNFTNLEPGETYYFWGRSRNSIGWGQWSERRSVALATGARVLVGSVWQRAVPYVRVDGVWKVAKPYVKNAGVWKETN